MSLLTLLKILKWNGPYKCLQRVLPDLCRELIKKDVSGRLLHSTRYSKSVFRPDFNFPVSASFSQSWVYLCFLHISIKLLKLVLLSVLMGEFSRALKHVGYFTIINGVEPIVKRTFHLAAFINSSCKSEEFGCGAESLLIFPVLSTIIYLGIALI